MLHHRQMLRQSGFLWYVDFTTYLVSGLLSRNLSYQKKNKFFYDVKNYQWDELYLYKMCLDHIIRRCVPDEEISSILHSCHAEVYGGHT